MRINIVKLRLYINNYYTSS